MKFWRITATGVLGIGAMLGVGSLSRSLHAQAYTTGQPSADQAPSDQSFDQPQSSDQPGDQARPGMVNYIEGAVSLEGSPLTNKSVGRVVMDPGQIVSTGEGKVEVLLNPGIFLRVDSNSAVKMISPSLTPSQVEVVSGRAGVEVDQLLKGNVVQIVNHGVTTQLVKTGYYEFDAENGSVMVFKGRAEVEVANDKWQKVTGGRKLMLGEGPNAKESKFQPNPQEDTLMNWSRLRSQYLAQANNQLAAQYYGAGFYPGWYWSPGLWSYTYLGFGYGPFYSPFGWGYYPLGWGGGWGGWYGWHGYPVHGHMMGGVTGFHDGAPGNFQGGMTGDHGAMGGGSHGGGHN
jgi:FecR protein